MISRREQIKKAGERLYLDKFMTLTGWAANVEESEPPDFILRSSSGIVGVELTELLKEHDEGGGSLAKRNEKRRAGALRGLAVQYYKSGGKPTHVKALWPNGAPDHLAAELVRALARAREQIAIGEQTRLPVGSDVYYLSALPPEFGDYSRWICVSDAVGSVSAIPTAEVERVVQAKISRLGSYRDRVDRVVLLVVANQMTNSGKWRLAPTFSPIVGSGFDEIHLLMYPDETARIDHGAAF